jgi:hypothetical protein
MAKTKTADTGFSLGAVPTAGPKKAGKVRKRIEIAAEKGEEMSAVQALGALKVIMAMAIAAETEIKNGLKNGRMLDYYVTEGCATKSQPENVDGYSGDHTASLQLRKRGANMPLSEDETALCNEHSVPLAVLPAPLQFNSDYMAGGDSYDPAKIRKLEAAIGNLIASGDLPADIIVRTGESKTVTTEESIATVFRMGDNVARMLLPVVSVMAIGAKYAIANDDVTPAIRDAATIMGLPKLRDMMTAAAKSPESVLNPGKKAA